jgi:hypothetical protein
MYDMVERRNTGPHQRLVELSYIGWIVRLVSVLCKLRVCLLLLLVVPLAPTTQAAARSHVGLMAAIAKTLR